MENWFIPYGTSYLPPAPRVLVLAPHPDDEIFGCGGAIKLLQQRGSTIEVIVLTDGAGNAYSDDRQAISLTRQAETNAALALLGLKPAQFWNLRDRSLIYDDSWSLRLESFIQDVDLVFAPSPSEVHPDHYATARGTISAMRLMAHQNKFVPNLMLYEVGAPLMPNFLLDITAVWDIKNLAMNCFQSQQAVRNYSRHINALNAFRTYTLPAQTIYAEAYKLLLPSDIVTGGELIQGSPHSSLSRDEVAHARQLETAGAEMERMQSQWVEEIGKLQIANRELETQNLRLMAEKEHVLHEKNLQTNALTAQISELDQVNQRQAVIVSELRAAQADLQRTNNDLLNSRSWRWTKPLRRLSNLLRPSR